MQLKTLTNMMSMVLTFRAEVPEMPLQQLQLFLAVALDEGVGSRDLERRYGITNATVSRNISALYKYPGQGREGLDWIRWEPDATDARKRNLFLTEKGRAILEKAAAGFEQ